MELKQCPFCGEDDLKIFEQSVKDNQNKPTEESYWFIGCRNGDCFITGPNSYISMEEAVEKWNTRP